MFLLNTALYFYKLITYSCKQKHESSTLVTLKFRNWNSNQVEF